jgi:hypothetical protein
MNKYNSYWKKKCEEMETAYDSGIKKSFWDGFWRGFAIGIVITSIIIAGVL